MPSNDSEPSSWRLANLALGLAALLRYAGANGLIPEILTFRWLPVPLLSANSTAGVLPFAVGAARIAIDLWLPASLLMVLFWIVGLHRKLGAPQARAAGVVLASAWVGYIAVTFLALIAEQRGAPSWLAVFVIFLGIVYFLLLLATIVATLSELIALVGYGSSPSHVPVAVLSSAIVPPILLFVPLLLAPGKPLAKSLRETTDFKLLCEGVGVRLMERPISPVRSIAYDWDTEHLTFAPRVERIETDWSGRIRQYGGFGGSEEQKKRPVFEFHESRREFSRSGIASINPDAEFYHFPDIKSSQPYYGVDALSADLLAFLEVENPAALRGSPKKQGSVRYKLTLTDRRSNAVLGVHTFVVDWANERACGANIGNTISQNMFIHDAINR